MLLKNILDSLIKKLFFFIIYSFATIVIASPCNEIVGNNESKFNNNILIANGIDFSILYNDKSPIFIKSNNINGNIEIRKLGTFIKSNQIDHPNDTGKIYSYGNTKIIYYDDAIFLEKNMYLNSYSFEGNMINPRFQKILSNFNYIHANNAKTVKKRDIVKNWFLYLRKIPILIVPKITFTLPVRNEQKSGFLIPTYGINSKYGFDINIPYYLNIYHNCDATISPRFLSKRGLSLDSEFRYSGPNYVGISEFNYMPKDNILHRNRWIYRWTHDHNFNNGFYANIEISKASDNNYFRDMSYNNINHLQSTNYLPKQILFGWSNKNWEIYAQTHKFQTLQDSESSISPPFDKIPEISLNGSYYDLYGVNAFLDCKIVHLKRILKNNNNLIESGSRFNLYPSMSYTLMKSGYYFTPKIGIYYSSYHKNQLFNFLKQTDNSSLIPVISFDTGISLVRNVSLFEKKFSQTLEPRCFYLYIPYRYQPGLSCFDTSMESLNLSNMFTEELYTGSIGRVSNANHITTIITSKIFDNEIGFDRISLSCAKRWCFENRKVLLNEEDFSRKDKSDFIFSMRTSLTETIKTDAIARYDNNKFYVSMIKVCWFPKKLTNLTLSYRYRGVYLGHYKSKNQIGVSSQWPFSKNLYGIGRVDYSNIPNPSFDAKLCEKIYSRITQSIIGLEYKSDCSWIGRLVFQNYAISNTRNNKAIFLQFELAGLGSNTINLLKKNIPGYQDIIPHKSTSSMFEMYE